MSSRNWASGVEKLEKSEASEAGKAASRKSSLAGARILGAPGSHGQLEPRGERGPGGKASRPPVPGSSRLLTRARAAASTGLGRRRSVAPVTASSGGVASELDSREAGASSQRHCSFRATGPGAVPAAVHG